MADYTTTVSGARGKSAYQVALDNGFVGTEEEWLAQLAGVHSVNTRKGDVVLSANDVGLGNVDNTSDANKPVSSATQDALDLKANSHNPSFTGTVTGVTAAMVGLGNVDNTSDADKPISTATQSALDARVPVNANAGFNETQRKQGRENVAVYQFASRAEAVAFTYPSDLPDGAIVRSGRFEYVKSSGATAISDWPDWLPLDKCHPAQFGGATLSDRWEAAAAFAASDGRVLSLTGINTLNRRVTLSGNLSIECAPGFSVVNGFNSEGQPMVTFGGGDVTQISGLSDDVPINSNRLKFSSAHGLSIGDTICIYNPTDGSFNAARDYYRAGEFCRVEAVISSTEVRICGVTYAGYTAASVDVYRVNGSRINITSGKFKAVRTQSSGSAGPVIYLREVVDSDVSGLEAIANGLPNIALGFIRCVNVVGTGVIGIQNRTDNAGTTDYGLYISHSQDISLFGARGHGRRHGITTSGGGLTVCTVPNRNCYFEGTFSNDIEVVDDVPVQASDFHGNTEYCTLAGMHLGGISPAGDKNVYRGVSISGPNGIACGSSEMLGFSHDFTGMKFECRNAIGVTASNAVPVWLRGISTNTVRGGVLNFSDTIYDAPIDCASTVRVEPSGRNASATGVSVIAENMVFKRTHANMTSCFSVFTSSGSGVVDTLNVFGSKCLDRATMPIAFYHNSTPDVQDVRQVGSVSISLPDNAASVTQTITYPRPYAQSPRAVSVTPVGGTGKVIVPRITGSNTTGFTVRLNTADGTNFSASSSLAVNWAA